MTRYKKNPLACHPERSEESDASICSIRQSERFFAVLRMTRGGRVVWQAKNNEGQPLDLWLPSYLHPIGDCFMRSRAAGEPGLAGAVCAAPSLRSAGCVRGSA